jgi:hypothetical protein
VAGAVTIRGRRFVATQGNRGASPGKPVPSQPTLTGIPLVDALDSYSKSMLAPVRNAFLQSVMDTLHNSQLAPIIADIRAGRIPSVSGALAQQLSYVSMDTGALSALVQQAYVGGAANTAANSPSNHVLPDAHAPIAQAFIQTQAGLHAAASLTNVDSNTRLAVNQMVSDAVKEGIGAPELADRLVDTIGLLPGQVQALDNYRAGLLAQQNIPKGRALSLASQYSTRLLAQRATTIARTEIASAVAGGRLAYYQTLLNANVIDGNGTGYVQQWVTAPSERNGTCPACAAMDKQNQTVGSWWNTGQYGYSQGPPLHPNCGCQVIVVPRATWMQVSKDNEYPRQEHGMFGFATGFGPGTGPRPEGYDAEGPKTEGVDAREGAGQQALNIQAPKGAEYVNENRNHVTDAYERLLYEQCAGRLEEYLGVMQEHTAETRNATFPVDMISKTHAIEVKSVSTFSKLPNQKATMKVFEFADKIKTAVLLKRQRATLVQVVNHETKTVGVFLWKGGYNSKNFRAMIPLFTYKFTLAQFKAAAAHSEGFRNRKGNKPDEPFRMTRAEWKQFLLNRGPYRDGTARNANTKSRWHKQVRKADEPSSSNYSGIDPSDIDSWADNADYINHMLDLANSREPEPGDIVCQPFIHQYRAPSVYIYVQDGPDTPAGTNAPTPWINVARGDVYGINPQTGKDSHGNQINPPMDPDLIDGEVQKDNPYERQEHGKFGFGDGQGKPNDNMARNAKVAARRKAEGKPPTKAEAVAAIKAKRAAVDASAIRRLNPQLAAQRAKWNPGGKAAAIKKAVPAKLVVPKPPKAAARPAKKGAAAAMSSGIKREADLARVRNLEAKAQLKAQVNAKVSTVATKPSTTAYDKDAAALQKSIATGVVSRVRLPGGAMAESVFKVTYKDGTEAVVKTFGRQNFGGSGVEKVAKEVLISKLAAIIGADVPTVVQTSDREITMRFVKGTPGFGGWNGGREAAALNRIIRSPSGQRLGLLDKILNNEDRNQGNWILGEDGKAWGLDHEFSDFGTSKAARAGGGRLFEGPFAEGAKLAASDWKTAEKQLSTPAVKAMFTAIKKPAWYASMIRVLAEQSNLQP